MNETNDKIVNGFSKGYAVKLLHQVSKSDFKFLRDNTGRRLFWRDEFTLTKNLREMIQDWEKENAHYLKVSVNAEPGDRIISSEEITLKFYGYGEKTCGGFGANQDGCYAKIVVVEKMLDEK